MVKELSIKKGIKKQDKPLIHIGKWRERPLRKYARALFMVSTGWKKEKNTILFSEDIAIGGVFLETSDPLPTGTKVKLRFPLESPYRSIQVAGTVVWARKELAWDKLGNKNPGMGIVFEKINQKDMDLLKEFLDHTHTYGWFL